MSANAAYLFTRVVDEHLRTYRTSFVKPNEIFDIVIQKDGWTSYKAILICGDPTKRTLAASGKSQWTTSGALEALLKLLSKAIAKEGRALRFDERDLQRTSDGVMNENLMG
ncbi:hypothetical protein HII31_07983 [Pseudocercospora fuligena]|uniref:Uncharacterized protein n=1 Tax=Pseudocercospora fuligena TaxID=685502 RepID=A0A8H6RFY6_9PEZI|nr:hypothetical protein HII31_07983 [Pseudocercospora fuligena]